MHKVEIPEAQVTFEFPSTVEELTEAQYLYYLKLVLLLQDQKITENEFKVKLTYKLIGLKPGKNTSPQKLENIYRLAELAESFIIEKEGKRSIDLNCIHNKIPTIQLGKKTFHGPGDVLSNITYGQFIAANNAYSEYSEGNKDALTELAAALYLPKGERFKNQTPEEWKNASSVFLFSVLLLFQSTIEFISTGAIVISNITVDLSILFKGGSSKGTNYGFTGVLFSMAETGVFGNTKQTAEANLYDVLLRLHQVLTEAKEQEEKNDTDRRS